MTMTQQLLTIAVVSLGTILTRFLPFLIFPAGKPVPKYMKFLGKFLPGAVFGMLVIYCLKGVSFLTPPYGIPEAIAVLAVIALHLWKKQTLLSIAGGTAVYMILVQVIFK